MGDPPPPRPQPPPPPPPPPAWKKPEKTKGKRGAERTEAASGFQEGQQVGVEPLFVRVSEALGNLVTFDMVISLPLAGLLVPSLQRQGHEFPIDPLGPEDRFSRR